jgi:hypothetical protein
MTKPPDPESVGTSGLTDADRTELDKLKEAWTTGGQEALASAQKELRQRDPICWFKILRTFYPALLRKIIGEEDAPDRDEPAADRDDRGARLGERPGDDIPKRDPDA